MEAMMPEAPDFPGAADVVRWFGYWPTFHDAEVLSIRFDRESGCKVAIYTFESGPDTDAAGFYVRRKDAVVTFSMEGFAPDNQNRVESFNGGNVLFGARVHHRPDGYELELDGCFGVEGSIVCERMSVTIEKRAVGHR